MKLRTYDMMFIKNEFLLYIVLQIVKASFVNMIVLQYFCFIFKDLKIECYKKYCNVTNGYLVFVTLTSIATSPLCLEKKLFLVYIEDLGNFFYNYQKKKKERKEKKYREKKPMKITFSFSDFPFFWRSCPFLLLKKTYELLKKNVGYYARPDAYKHL